MIPFIFLLISAVSAQYLGCFSDNAVGYAVGLPFRDLPVLQTAQTSYTPPQCVSACTGLGYFYAGIQNGRECYCGNSYGKYCLGVSSACKTPCTADSSQLCGSPNYNGIYVAVPGGPGQNKTCTCGTNGGCANIGAVTTAFGCATAQDASNIEFVVSATGGVAPLKYSVNNSPFTTNTLYSVSAEGNYTVTAVDNLGATVFNSVFAGPAKRVVASPIPYVPYGSLAGYRTSAVGIADAVVTAASTGGTAPVKYTLYPGNINVAYAGVGGNFSALAAGDYNLIATDATGCRSTPVAVVVYTPTVADAPTGIVALDNNAGQKPVVSVSWTAPVFNGYTRITGYFVMLGYWDIDSNVIVWFSNKTVTTTTSTTIPDVMNNSTRRFVSIATINAIGTGAQSPVVEFQGLCAAGRYANSSVCLDCAAGTNTVGTIGRSVCRACAAGTYSAQASPTCTSCAGNTYSGAGASTCSACSPGYITGLYYCQPCAPGTFNAGTSTSCTPCAANTYSSQPASPSCAACPPGTSSNAGAAQCYDATGYKK